MPIPETVELFSPRGLRILLDADCPPEVRNARWHIRYSSGHPYAVRNVWVKRKKTKLILHRYLLGLKPGDKAVCDHINGDTLDNRMSNLRVCSRPENAKNRRMNRANTCGFKGVHKSRSRYRAVIQVDKVKKSLGTFADPIDAAKAYDAAATALHGPFACLNFPPGNSEGEGLPSLALVFVSAAQFRDHTLHAPNKSPESSHRAVCFAQPRACDARR